MKLRNLILIGIFALSSTFAFAGGDKAGNAGKSLVCFSNDSVLKEIRDPKLKGTPEYGLIRDQDIAKITFIEAYDLYEAKLPDLRYPEEEKKIFPIRDDETEWNWVKRFRARFEGNFPFIREVIPDPEEIFSQFIKGDKALAPVDDIDSAWVFEPSLCTPVTTVLQKRIGDFGRIHFDMRLYSHPLMSKISRAVLLLHETVYYTQLHRFHLPKPPIEESSAITRALLSLILPDDLRDVPTVGKLAAEMIKLGYPIKLSTLHPFLHKPIYDLKEKMWQWIENEVYYSSDEKRPTEELPFQTVRSQYLTPLERTLAQLQMKIRSPVANGISYAFYSMPNFASYREWIERAHLHGVYLRAGDCESWDIDGRCIRKSDREVPVEKANKEIIKNAFLDLARLEKENNQVMKSIREHFSARLRAYLESEVSLTALQTSPAIPAEEKTKNEKPDAIEMKQNGHSKEFLQGFREKIIALHTDYATHWFFALEVAPRHSDIRNRKFSRWSQWSYQLYDIVHELLCEYVKSRPFITSVEKAEQ